MKEYPSKLSQLILNKYQTMDAAVLDYDEFIMRLAAMNPIPGQDLDDVAQEFRMVFVKCARKYDPDRGAQFDTYFITSCKNRVKNMKAQYYAESRPQIELSLDRSLRGTGIPPLEYLEEKSHPEHDLVQRLVDLLAETSTGHITMDYIFGGLNFNQLGEKYGISASSAYRAHQANLKYLKNTLENAV